MNRKEYEQKLKKYIDAIKEIRQKQIDLENVYAADLAKRNGLKEGDVILDRDGNKYYFYRVEVNASSHFVWGRKPRADDGGPGSACIVWNYKLKEE